MSGPYILPIAQQAAAYDSLQQLANTYTEKDATCDSEPLSDMDFLSWKEVNSTQFSLELKTPAENKRKTVTVYDPRVLKELYRRLCQNDADHNGKLDGNAPAQEIEITEAGIETIGDLDRQRLMLGSQNSVFTISVQYEADTNMTTDVNTGFIMARTENAGTNPPTYTYHLATLGLDQYRRNETAFFLTSLSGDFSFTDVKLVGSDRQSQLVVLSFTSQVRLDPLPLATQENGPGVGQPLLQIGPLAEPMRLIDEEFGFASYPFALNRAGADVGAATVPEASMIGAPLVDESGHITGLLYNWNVDPTTTRMFLAATTIKTSYDKIIEGKGTPQYGHFGLTVEVIPLNDARRSLFPANENYAGILVNSIEPEGPAAKAGIQPNDIILAIDNNTQATTVLDSSGFYAWQEAELAAQPDEQIKIRIFRPSATTLSGDILTVTLNPVQKAFGPVAVAETSYGFNVRSPDLPSNF